MATIADQKAAATAVIQQNATAMVTPSPEPKQQTVSAIDANPGETPVEPIFESLQTIKTNNRVAVGRIVNKFENVKMTVQPMIDREVYSIDVVDDGGRIVFNVNAHSGKFNGTLPIPKGNYHYYIKTEKSEMPFTVKLD